MTDTRQILLDLLAARPGLSQGELARRAGCSDRTARRHLKALVDGGEVHVTADGNARRYRLADHAHPSASAPPLTEVEIEALSVAALAEPPRVIRRLG